MESQKVRASIWRTITERRPVLMTVAVFAWSAKYVVELGLTHTTGPEIYGVLTAALATGAAIANLAIFRSARTPVLVTAALLALWAVIAAAGIAGAVAHVIGPVAGHGPIDLRPRPIAAPLVFTGLGLVGGAALFLGRRPVIRRPTLNREGA